MKRYSVGVDIGGSHIACAVVDLTNNKILEHSFVVANINNNASAENILSKWANAIKRSTSLINICDLSGIGFGMPGPFDYCNGIGKFEQVEKFYGLKNIDITKHLTKLLDLPPTTPIRYINDASAFAIGEAWIGSAAKLNNSVSITLGTGFGSAFVRNEVPVVEGKTVPTKGCVWHLPYKKSIADDYFSTRWFIRRFYDETGLKLKGVKEIAEAAKENTIAQALFIEYGQNMGEFLCPWLKNFNANILVIGGNISNAYHLFGSAFESTLKNNNITTRIKLSSLKENAAIIGSARLLNENYWKKTKPTLAFM